jgi:hypothetical protein
MTGDGNLLVLVVGGGHPKRKAPVIHQGLGRKLEDVVQHGDEAVWFPWWDKVGLSVFASGSVNNLNSA